MINTFTKCFFCNNEGERFSANPLIFLCGKHAEKWQKQHHKVFPHWKENPQLISDEMWHREFNSWANRILEEKVAFT
jgi:hypothetical protein